MCDIISLHADLLPLYGQVATHCERWIVHTPRSKQVYYILGNNSLVPIGGRITAEE